MKKFIILTLLLLSATAFAQTHPTTFQWVLEDSADAIVWNVGVTLDSDTSQSFSVSRMPETGLGFQFYWNCGDSGTVVAILQQNSLLGANSGDFLADSAAAIDYISSWVIADSVILPKPAASGTTAARGSYVWNPTLVGPAENARIILCRRAGTVIRTISIIRVRQD